jgi:dehydrogenase/reductase SDR family protein 12
MSFGQLGTTTQFFLYGKKHCTKDGWLNSSRNYPTPDILTDINLDNKVFLITGANAGIGYGITHFLASKNATIYMVCRNKERGQAKRDEIVEQTKNEKIHLLIGDCGLEKDVRRVWDEFCTRRRSMDLPLSLDCLICNAGALSNELTFTEEQIETTFATHLLFGTYLLTNLALPVLQSTPSSRVVVVSSGGMYTTKFPEWEIATSQKGTYSGQLAYAYAKRAQVLLCEQWTKLYPSVKFLSCHPGWVDTPGVDSAYGDTKSYLEPLRNTWEGTEGIIWLAVAPDTELRSGEFYLGMYIISHII